VPIAKTDGQPLARSERLVLVKLVALGLAAVVLLAGCATGQRATSSAGSAAAHPASPAEQPTFPAAPAMSCAADDVYAHQAGEPVHDVATLASTSAALTGTTVELYASMNALRDGQLTVTRAGTAVVSAAIRGPADDQTAQLSNLGVNAPAAAGAFAVGGPLCLARFAPDGPVTALVALTLDGAHCCAILRSYTESAPPAEHNFGNAWPQLVTDAGQPLIAAADDAFYYAFASYAGSAAPLSLYVVRNGVFIDVTREHPDLVRADAARLWSSLTDRSADAASPISVMAAWVADECVLGRDAEAWQAVAEENARGALTSRDPGYPAGASFVSNLQVFLAGHKYCAPVGAATASPPVPFVSFEPSAGPAG
jgi:hypothetical protein